MNFPSIDLKWEDSGAPITCSFDPESNADENDMPNSIDPAVFEDDFDDSAHLVYGGNRIWMTELNPNSGMQIEENWWEENDPTYHFLAIGKTLTLKDPGGILPIGQEIACHFSQDHTMVTKFLDFIHKHPNQKLVKFFFYYLDRLFRNSAETDNEL